MNQLESICNKLASWRNVSRERRWFSHFCGNPVGIDNLQAPKSAWWWRWTSLL